jgi:hypothetical protein
MEETKSANIEDKPVLWPNLSKIKQDKSEEKATIILMIKEREIRRINKEK